MSAAPRVLGLRELNRALLERQMLLRRTRVPALDAVEHLVGLQAQEPRDPYVALWTRLDRFRAQALAEPMTERRAVRMTLHRGTLHLVTARDAVALRALIQPGIARTVLGSSPVRKVFKSADVDELLAFLRSELEREPRTRAQLVEAIHERWPRRDASSLGYAMYLLPTVQATPRGVWGKGGRSAFTTMEHWLGRSPDAQADPADMVLRYLGAFGPATPADAQYWCGVAGMRELFERLRPRLRTFRDERGRELFDVPGAPLPNPDTDAPVRFLPEYDNIVLGHKDRSRIVPQGSIPMWTEVGWGTVLVDGSVAARWKAEIAEEASTLRIESFRTISRADRAAASEEGNRLLAFLAPDVGRRDVRLAAASRWS